MTALQQHPTRRAASEEQSRRRCPGARAADRKTAATVAARDALSVEYEDPEIERRPFYRCTIDPSSPLGPKFDESPPGGAGRCAHTWGPEKRLSLAGAGSITGEATPQLPLTGRLDLRTVARCVAHRALAPHG